MTTPGSPGLGATPPVARRGLIHNEAAAFCGLTVKAFDAEVTVGRLPGPVFPNRRPRVWDRVALEREFDTLPKTSASSASPFIETLHHGKDHAQAR